MQIPLRRRSDFQEIQTDAPKKDKTPLFFSLFFKHMTKCLKSEEYNSPMCRLWVTKKSNHLHKSFWNAHYIVQWHHSSCFLRKNCSAESHWSLGKRLDNSPWSSSWKTLQTGENNYIRAAVQQKSAVLLIKTLENVHSNSWTGQTPPNSHSNYRSDYKFDY